MLLALFSDTAVPIRPPEKVSARGIEASARCASRRPRPQMDNRIVAQSFLTAPREMLAAQLALLDQTTLAKLLKSKATDLFSDEKGEFNRIVDEAARHLVNESAPELVLRLLGALNTILGIPARRYVAPRDFEDNGEEILARCLAVLRETEEDFSGADLQDMLRFLMNKMFGEIGKRFESLSSDKQQEVVDAVRKFIEDLPEVQREKLRNEIGADEITDSYIRKAIVSGTLSTAFAAAVSVGGFAFYAGAVSLLATLAGLVGLTLPFSVYIGLTSTIAVISNPLFFIPVLAGGGWWHYSRQNQKMRRRIAPLVVTQSVLAYLAGRANGIDHADESLRLWQAAWTEVERSRADLVQAERALAATQEELSRTKNWIRVLNQRQEQQTKDVREIHTQLKALCVASANDIASACWGDGVREGGQKLKTCLDATERCRTRHVKTGISGVFDRIGRSLDTWDSEQKADSAAAALASALIEINGHSAKYPSQVNEMLRRHGEIKARQQELELEVSDNRRKKAALEGQEGAEQQQRYKCQAERSRTESRYWGLSEIK